MFFGWLAVTVVSKRLSGGFSLSGSFVPFQITNWGLMGPNKYLLKNNQKSEQLRGLTLLLLGFAFKTPKKARYSFSKFPSNFVVAGLIWDYRLSTSGEGP